MARVLFATALIVLAGSGSATGGVMFIEPIPYLRAADSPFGMSGLGSTFFMEDFEDGVWDLPSGVTAGPFTIGTPGVFTDEPRWPCVAGLVAGGLPATLDLEGVGKISQDEPVDPFKNTGASCSGTLLPSGRHVLTAAHCFEDSMDANGNFTGTFVYYFPFFDADTHIGYPFTISNNSSVHDTFVHPGFNATFTEGTKSLRGVCYRHARVVVRHLD